MELNIQKYLREHGIDKLKEEFSIKVHEYPEKGIAVYNYNMISSPRFHPICDEARGLILKANTWEIVSFPFCRFFNYSEGVQQNDTTTQNTQRIASTSEYETIEFDLSNAIIENKIDGSMCCLWFDGNVWQVATRSMAYAEGQTNLGRSFRQVFMEAAQKTNIFGFLDSDKDFRNFTWITELTSPENRVVTNYPETEITLIGARNILEANNYRELSVTELDNVASVAKIDRPQYFWGETWDELLGLVKDFSSMSEGVVLKIENPNGSHLRLKVKNPKYLAVAHLRGNGQISPHRILSLVMANDQAEYLSYFACDKPYFSFVEAEYAEVINRIKSIYRDHMAIKEQKEFALSIVPKAVYSFEKGVIFALRKSGGTAEEHLNSIGAKKIALGMNLKKKFIDKFHVVVEEEGENESK